MEVYLELKERRVLHESAWFESQSSHLPAVELQAIFQYFDFSSV
jgi:hypothetical protein